MPNLEPNQWIISIVTALLVLILFVVVVTSEVVSLNGEGTGLACEKPVPQPCALIIY